MADSSNDPRDLSVIQKWMQSVVTHVGGVTEGINMEQSRRFIDIDDTQIESIVTRSEKRTSIERLEVYANAYHARLIECLRSIFPIFARTVGDEVFDEFAVTYLQHYPSRSYTLNRLGDRFPEFLEETSPNKGTEVLGFEEFLVGLAVVERSIDAVFDGPGFEGREVVSPKQLEGISPDAFWEATLSTVPCLRLHSFPFPINDFITAVKKDPQALIPRFAPSYLALTRKDFVVRRVPLTRFQYHLLLGLQQGSAVGQAIEGALIEVGEREDLPEMLAAAFQKFASEQLFLMING